MKSASTPPGMSHHTLRRMPPVSRALIVHLGRSAGTTNRDFLPDDARSQASRSSWRRRSLADGQSLRSYSAMSGHFSTHGGGGHGLALPRPGQSDAGQSAADTPVFTGQNRSVPDQ